jgi:hypothetical protein
MKRLVSITTALPVFAFVGLVIGFTNIESYSQTDEPVTVEIDVPFETRAPWFTRNRLEIEDEVLLRGTLHVTSRVWASSSTHIDRVALHANAVDIYGTSETTGQRFRLNGSFSIDLRDPNVTINPDGSFDMPFQQGSLFLHKVDPEPASLTGSLSIQYSWGSSITPTPTTVTCQRVYAPDGTATAYLNCGSTRFAIFLTPVLYAYRVLAAGDNCVPVLGNVCSVPDGAILFNGYTPTAAYRPPLILQARVLNTTIEALSTIRLRWHCKTGERESPIFPVGTGFMGCRPIYSSTEPITVYAEVSYQFYAYAGYNQPMQLVTAVVTERPFTFHMLERPMDQPPIIQSFSVQATSRSTGRCDQGQLCELADGDVLFNGQVGDYNPPLSLRLTATDTEGDPILVDWFCKSGSYFAPITNLGFGQYSCDPGYIYPDTVLVYARVSDGNNVVWSEQQRELYFLEFVH